MDIRRHSITCHARRAIHQIGWSFAASLLLAMALAPSCRADATLQVTASGRGPLSASAHVDFRITVLPSLGLSAQASGLRIQGNSGVLTLQRGPREAGTAPTVSTALRPHRQVTDISLLASAVASSELVTIASP
jgi:hypothetical protein